MAVSKPFIPCLTCAKLFKSEQALLNHKKDTYHFKGPHGEIWDFDQKLSAYFDAYYEEDVMVLRNDRRESRLIVQKELRKLVRKFKQYEGGDFYSIDIKTAGSTSTQTKILNADEYDFNVKLKVDPEEIAITHRNGEIFFEVTGKVS